MGQKLKVSLLIGLIVCVLAAIAIEVYYAYHPMHLLHNRLRQCGHSFDRLCTEAGATYWIAAGTMLGAAREQNIIPHDDDIDVAMTWGDLAKLEALVRGTQAYRRRYQLRRFLSRYTGIYRFSVAGLDGINFDVFPVEEHDGVLRYTYSAARLFPKETFHPAVRTSRTRYQLGTFLNTEGNLTELWMWGPTDLPTYCRQHYGSSWKTPIIGFTHSVTGFRQSHFYLALGIPLWVSAVWLAALNL
jgi:hypothetical protein